MRTKGRLILVLLVVSAAAILVVASCAPQATPTSPPAKEPTIEPTVEPTVAKEELVQVSIWTAYATQLEPAAEAYNAKMKAEGKNVEIVMVEVGFGEIPDKFAVGLTTGDVPDILDLDLVLAPKFASMGAFMDITELVEQAGLRDDFNPKFLDLGIWDDKIYMIPFSADVSAMFYNKETFRQAGLDPDTPIETWDDFRAAAVAIAEAGLKTKDGRPVYAWVKDGTDAGAQMFCDMPFVWTSGGGWLNDKGEVIFESPETVEAMQWMSDLIHKDNATPPNLAAIGWDDKMNMFYDGQACMICTGSYAIAEAQERAPDLDFGMFLFPHPVGKGGPSSFIGGDLIGIPKDSKHPEAAWDFILYTMSEEIQVEIWAKAGMPPVRTSMGHNKYFDAEPRYQIFAEGVRVGKCPKTVHYNELYDPWGVAWSEVIEGQRPVPDILSDAADRMRAIVSK